METEKKPRNNTIADDSMIRDWVLIEILRRLPSRSVFKFKTVSKRWLSIISDPSFASLYVSRDGIFSPAPAPRCSLLCRHLNFGAPASGENLPLPDVIIKNHTELNSPNLKLGFLPRPQTVQVLAAENGLLLCISGTFGNRYCVCNPITAQWAGVPDPPSVLESHKPKPFGLGFLVRNLGSDSVYNIVLVRESGKSHSKFLELDIFDSGSGQWRKAPMALSSHPELNMGRRYKWVHIPGVVYNGVLHWQAKSGRVHKIIAFDPEMHELEGDDYRCRVFDLPTDESYPEYIVAQRLLGLSGGELRYAEVVGGPLLYVWSLRDYDSGKWRLDHRIVVSELSLLANCSPNGKSLYVWAFDPLDKELVYFDFNGEADRSVSLVSYNMSRPKMKLLCTHYPVPVRTSHPTIRLSFENVHFALPFVLPPWPTPVSPQPAIAGTHSEDPLPACPI